MMHVIFLAVLIVAAFQTANATDQNVLLSTLLERINAVDNRVASLDTRVTSLEHRLDELSDEAGASEEVEMDFKVVSVEYDHNRENSTFTFTMNYEAAIQPKIFTAPTEWTPATELAHEQGTAQFSFPDRFVSPIMFVVLETGLFYTLTLITGGPLTADTVISNLALTTTPDHGLPYEGNGEVEVTLTSRVIGPRSVRTESMSYYVYSIISDYEVEVNQFHIDDTGSESDDEEGSNERLRMIEYEQQDSEIRRKLKLDTLSENRGLLYLKEKVVFNCTGGCLLYDISVTKLIAYFREDLFTLSNYSIVPHRSYLPPDAVDGFVGFVRYGSAEATVIHEQTVTCSEGTRCLLICDVFGDNPTANFSKVEHLGGPESDRYVHIPAMPNVQAWSFHLAFAAHSFVEFDPVSREAAGEYACLAVQKESRVIRIQHTALEVL